MTERKAQGIEGQTERRKNTPELLAPAGDLACLKTAVQHGADAVYLAGQRYGARGYAKNFSDDELICGAEYCHVHGTKIYVTVNTLVLDREFEALGGFAQTLCQAGVDGIIVQDLGVLRAFSRLCPSIPIHASTQMAVHNLSGVRQLERLGVRRVVLARELTLKEMKSIAEGCHAELEVFVHGAMCMSYSGQCLMSSMLGGRSGNRGRCAQPCRLLWSRESDRQERYFLSLKDMCLVEHLEQLRKAGAASLKIEGRMKGPEYVAQVVSVYRSCLDRGTGPAPEELEGLKRIFNRGGLTDGYFTGRIGKEMFAFLRPENPYGSQKEMSGISKPETSMEEDRKIPVSAKLLLKEGAPPELEVCVCDSVKKNMRMKVCGTEPLASARNSVITQEQAAAQMEKTGETPFVMKKISVQVEGKPFAPVQLLNQLRRKGLTQLEKQWLISFVHPQPMPKEQWRVDGATENPDLRAQFTCRVSTAAQLHAVWDMEFESVYVPLHIAIAEEALIKSGLEKVILCPPVIIKDHECPETAMQLEHMWNLGVRKLCVEQLGELDTGLPFELYGSWRLNIINSEAMEQVRDMGISCICLSTELNVAQIRDLKKPIAAEVLIYGHLPLMITENCILKNMDECPCQDSGKIVDRTGAALPILRDGISCRSIVCNAVPVFMGDRVSMLEKVGVSSVQLLFTVETPKQCQKISSLIFSGRTLDEPYTRGHFVKGIHGA